MIYRKKAAILSGLVMVLLLANILTFVFDPAKPGSSAFAWLDPSLLAAADHIEIYGRAGNNTGASADGPIILARRNNI